MNVEEAIQSSGFKNERQKAVVNLMYVAYEVKTRISRVLKDYGLTPEQYNVLRILKGKYPNQMCVRDIARRTVERSSNVPRIIDRLEVKKLVRRSHSGTDRRETVIILAQPGINLLETINPAMEAAERTITSLTEGEINQLNKLLDRYLQD
jgi:DNA-binding MarR family transcriptional regulator